MINLIHRLVLLVVLMGFIVSAWAQGGPRPSGRGLGPKRPASNEVKSDIREQELMPTQKETLKAKCVALEADLEKIQKMMNETKKNPIYNNLDTLRKQYHQKLAEILILRGITATKDNLASSLKGLDLKAMMIEGNLALKNIVALTLFDAMDSLFIDIGNKQDFFKDTKNDEEFLVKVQTQCATQDKKLCKALTDKETKETTEKMIKGYYKASRTFDPANGFSEEKLKQFSVFLNDKSSLDETQRKQLKDILSEVILNGGRNPNTALPNFLTPADKTLNPVVKLEEEVASIKKQISDIYDTSNFKDLANFAAATRKKIKEENCENRTVKNDPVWFDCLPNADTTLKPFASLFNGVGDIIDALPTDTPFYGPVKFKQLCEEKPFSELNLTVCSDFNPATPEKEFKFFKTKEGQNFLKDLRASPTSKKKKSAQKPWYSRLMGIGTQGINAYVATDKNAKEANNMAQQEQLFQAQMAQAQQQMAMQQQMMAANQAQNAGQTLGSIGAVGVSNAALNISATQLGAMSFTPTRADYISSKYGSFDSKNQFVVRPFNV